MKTFLKDPQAVTDYGFDWSDWLATGDAIATSIWSVPSGITEDSESETDTITTIWVSGGTVGSKYRITNTITTDNGNTEERSFYIKVVNR